MDNENKKVNNAENTNPQSNPALDEITDGFFDLSSIYQTPVKKSTSTRAEELRRRDEQRRELEMQAIREDIERRYSLQLETAQNNAAPKKDRKPPAVTSGIVPDIDEREAVREELERIDEIINGDVVGKRTENTEESPSDKKKKRKKSKKAASKPQKDFDIEEANPVYALFYSYGDVLCRVLSAVFTFVFGIVKKPFVYLFESLSRATESTKRKSLTAFRATVREAVNFRSEIRRAAKRIRKAFRKPSTLPSVIFGYIRQAFSRHTGLLKTGANILMPVAALMILIFTVNYWNSATFALEVIYNEKSIGYISNESVYIEAKGLVKDRLSGSAYASAAETANIEATVAASPNLNANYKLSVVSVDQLNDAQAISDRIIENSVDNLTHACGVYIDGEFICAVKNEADAKTVFYDILEPYEADAKANGYVVGFAETIDYVQGLYRDDKDAMWDAAKLSAVLTGSEKAGKTHTVGENETLASVVAATGISEEDLRSLNPLVDWENLQPGSELLIESGEKLVSIRKIVTSTYVQDIKFETVKRRDATKYSGYRQVLQKGVNGSERVTKTQIYIDGALMDTEYSYETIVDPVEEIVTIGTRTSYGGVYIGEASDSGFLWPAPSCHRVSSPYGWRSSGWHNGIDLVKAGGGASGTPVIASKSGRVEVVQRSNSGYGNMVLINHGDGYKTRYAHMIKGSITVSVGDYVDAGQTIGKVGSTGNSTGPHLHFEVIRNGETQNPKNYIY